MKNTIRAASLTASFLILLSVIFVAGASGIQTTSAATNLVVNPSVETVNGANQNQPLSWATDLWGTTKATFSYLTTGHTGSRSVKVQITKAGTGDAKWYFNEVPVTVGQTYLFSDYWMSNIKSQVTIVYHLKSGSYKYVNLGTLSASTSWQQFQKSFVVPANVTALTVFHLITAVGSLTVDDYSLTTGTTSPTFDFSMSNGGAKSVVQGQSVTNSITATLSSGVTQSVTFSASGLPTGATASYSSNSCNPTCSTTLTVNTIASTPAGTYTVVVSGVSGSLTRTTSFSLTVNTTPPPPTFNFSLSNVGAKSVVQGQSVTNSITATLSSGTAQSVTFSTSGLPTGATASYSSNSCNPTCSSVLTLSTITSTPVGTYTITVTGTSGSLVPTTSFTLNVTAPVPPSNNIVLNPSVENAASKTATTPTSWTTDNWGTNKATFTYLRNQGHTGSSSVKVQMTSYTDGDAKWHFNPVSVTPLDTYDFTDWYQSNIETHVVIDFTNTDGTDYYLELRTAPAASTWTQYEESFQVPYLAKTMTIYHMIEAVGSLTTDDYSLVKFTPKGFARPIITLTFDNGFEDNITTAIPLLDQYGFKVSYCFSTEYVEGQPSQISIVQSIANDGQEVCSHSVHHSDMTLEDPTTLTYELTHSQSYLQGLTGQLVDNFLTPLGAYNDSVLNAIKLYYRSHRPTDEGFNTEENFDQYRLKVQNMQPSTTLAQFQSWVNQAVKDKSWLVIVYHQIVPTGGTFQDFDTAQADFKPQLEVLKNSGVAIETWGHALDELSPQVGH